MEPFCRPIASRFLWDYSWWLDAITDSDFKICALFDEDNGFVRLSALRFLCTLGATTENRSQKVWPLLDEAIQCYHGDYEYQDMLTALISFSTGKLAPEVKEGLSERVAFDAQHSKGALKRRSQQIIDNLA